MGRDLYQVNDPYTTSDTSYDILHINAHILIGFILLRHQDTEVSQPA